MPHIHELIDYTAEVFIVHQSKVLIRLHDKYNIRTCPGGHIELDETPQDAAIREAKEETGLDIKLYDGHVLLKGIHGNQTELIPPVFMNIHTINEKHSHIGMIYFGYSETDNVTPLYTNDASNDRRRMSSKDIENAQDMLEPIKMYAAYAIRLYSQ